MPTRRLVSIDFIILLRQYTSIDHSFPRHASLDNKEVSLTIISWFLIILAVGFVMTSLLVLLAKPVMVMITAIGIGSVLLSILFFLLNAPYAGAVELSVGAGLISVLFIITTSLTNKRRRSG